MLRKDQRSVGLITSVAEEKVTYAMTTIKRLYRHYAEGRYVAPRVFLGVASLVSFVLASGAGMHWN